MTNHARVEAQEIASGIAAGAPLYYLDMSSIADEGVSAIAHMSPHERVTRIRELLNSYGQPGDNEGTAGMILTRLQAHEFIDNLVVDLSNTTKIKPVGYYVEYGSGRWGNCGKDVERAAFSTISANQFINYLVESCGKDKENLKTVSLGMVNYVDLEYIPPSF